MQNNNNVGHEVDVEILPGVPTEVTQWALYIITYGIMLEISLMYVRYRRDDEDHDEIHAALNILAFMIAFANDIWYVVSIDGHVTHDLYQTTNF
jgi:hypothetical protein